MSGHQERGLLMNRDALVVLGLDIKINLVGAFFAGIRRHSNNHSHFMIFGTGDINHGFAEQLNAVHPSTEIA
jgi:hypothetical protein